MSVTLIDFLRARLDDDERIARAASLPLGEAWIDMEGSVITRNESECYIGTVGAEMAEAESEHIARHDPARVLREVAAKRAILEVAAPYVDDREDRLPAILLSALAAVYADHPDYRAEWSV